MQVSPPQSATEYTWKQFDNGLRLVTAPMPHARSVAVSIYIGAGSRYEATRCDLLYIEAIVSA